MFRTLRRCYQLFFFGLFLFLVLVTTARFIRGYPVEWFLALDPLAAVGTALASHRLHHSLLWALPVIVLTAVFGRFFCGWVCPMGVLHHALGWLFRRRKPAARVEANRPRAAQKVKYGVLAVMLGMAAAGSLQIGLLDPIASTWRGLATTVLPAAGNLAFGLYQGERHFQAGPLLLAVFFGALALNLLAPRTFCRILCPLGALLGLLSRVSLFRLTRKSELCRDCNACSADCQGAAEPHGTLRTTECMLCLNCVSSCPRGALRYAFLPEAGSTDRVDLGRRRWVGAAVAGLASVPLLRASAEVEPRPDPRRIRPPGAREERDFLERCLKCGACMKACPTGGLQPALTEAGLEGLWTPVLVPRIGSCEHECVLCSQVCPTGAIAHLSREQKVGAAPYEEPVRIGSAHFDRGRCLPWAHDTPCLVCEEVCPTSPKAIYLKRERVDLPDGTAQTLQRPYLDLARCIGCGTCEARCPIFDLAGVRVTSVGESRSSTNRLMLDPPKSATNGESPVTPVAGTTE